MGDFGAENSFRVPLVASVDVPAVPTLDGRAFHPGPIELSSPWRRKRAVRRTSHRFRRPCSPLPDPRGDLRPGRGPNVADEHEQSSWGAEAVSRRPCATKQSWRPCLNKRPLNPGGYTGQLVRSTLEEERPMCRQVTCRRCGNATWAGCGQHVNQVMAGVSKSKRCQCPPKASFVERIFGGRKSSV